MAALELSSIVSKSSTDPNNNLTMKSYSLRPRASRKCEEDAVAEPEPWRPPRTKSKRKQKSVPLSKYRRKTANARERSRMREINEAFEALRRAIPQILSRDCGGSSGGEKLTKISTLRLAMKYISALDGVLQERELESDGESLSSALTSPAGVFSDPSTSVSSDIFADLLPLADSLPGPADPCLHVPAAMFDNSSYVFDDAQFITDFS